MGIKERKKDHVSLTTSGEVDYRTPTGLQHYQFKHNALPEVDVEEISTEARFLGRLFSFPLFISSMTGGYTDAGAVNAIIAEFCEKHNLPFGVGSQRIMLEDSEATSTFSIVREKAPTAFIASNIGGAQLIGGLSTKRLTRMIDSIKADAVIVHLNPLQELMQPEGDRNFKGILEGVAKLCSETDLPIIVKETGAGISGEVAQRLLEVGISVIDVAGAGGTSWAKVENSRSATKHPDESFNDWGLSTVQCLNEVEELRSKYKFELIASGGIRSSHDIAKSICLGANFSASAQPVIKAVIENGREGLENLYSHWRKQMITILALLGCKKVSGLNKEHLQIKPPSR